MTSVCSGLFRPLFTFETVAFALKNVFRFNMEDRGDSDAPGNPSADNQLGLLHTEISLSTDYVPACRGDIREEGSPFSVRA
jgi:hypothetical protein